MDELEIAQQLSAINNIAEDWSQSTNSKIKGAFLSYLKGGSSGEAVKAFRPFVKKDSGLASKISFKMLRYSVFFHKDVGKGRPVGRSVRSPRPFLNEVLENEVPKLSDAVTDVYQDAIINQSKMLIQ